MRLKWPIIAWLSSFPASKGSSTISHNQNEKVDWRSLSCTNPAVKDVLMDAATAWKMVGADQAWEELKQAWKDRDQTQWPITKDTQAFTKFASEFFHGPEDMRCGLGEGFQAGSEESCSTSFMCNSFEGIPGTGPAGMFVLNSFVRINNVFENSHYTLTHNLKDRYFQKDSYRMREFTRNFILHKEGWDEQFVNFLIANTMTTGLTMGLAPTFKDALPQDDVSEDNLRDALFALISVIEGATKEMIGSYETSKEDDSMVETTITTALEALIAAHEQTGLAAFNGNDESLNFLDKAIAHGKMIGRGISSATATDLEQLWTKAIYTSLISHVWHVSGITPVVLDTSAECETIDVGVGKYISPKLAEYAQGCVDGKLYYLVDPDGRPKYYDRALWPDNSYSEPKGLKVLASGSWRGVRGDEIPAQDLITSAVRFTQKYGNRKDPWEHWDSGFKESRDEIWDIIKDGKNMVVLSGVVDIPVCKESEARDNWVHRHGDKLPRYYQYPCNET